MGEFDCVVEAKMMIKLGSPDTGIMEVVKAMSSRQLDSDLQRTALELAQLKASNEADIKAERTRLAYRSSEAERATTLYSRQIASTKARDEAVTEKELVEHALARAELEHKMAQVDMAQAQIRLDRRSVRSPVNGVVADVTIRPGEYVYEQTPLMTIAEIDPLYVKVLGTRPPLPPNTCRDECGGDAGGANRGPLQGAGHCGRSRFRHGQQHLRSAP
jgi:multidrug efflux pump subunit AcrA (membrane-fusion protein)